MNQVKANANPTSIKQGTTKKQSQNHLESIQISSDSDLGTASLVPQKRPREADSDSNSNDMASSPYVPAKKAPLRKMKVLKTAITSPPQGIYVPLTRVAQFEYILCIVASSSKNRMSTTSPSSPSSDNFDRGLDQSFIDHAVALHLSVNVLHEQAQVVFDALSDKFGNGCPVNEYEKLKELLAHCEHCRWVYMKGIQHRCIPKTK